MTAYRRLILLALALTTLVVVFGAYVRLSDAGLGCPDWPGCYGQLSPHHAADEILETHAVDPHGPVSLPKAWKEMIHRYLAASLGLLILAIAFLAWRRRGAPGVAPGLAAALVGVVIFQGLLGKWTVTLLLKPAIVTAHLIGGLTTLALLAWLALHAHAPARTESPRRYLALARTAFILLALQIALGGWTSTNYAALACTDFPSCQGSLWPPADYANAFHVLRELGMTADGDALPLAALTAIHWSHRVGAALAGTALLALGAALLRRAGTRRFGAALLVALAVQLALGVANVLLSLPLPLAVAHNAGAAALVIVMVWINHGLRGACLPAPVAQRRAGHAGRENSYA
ncbi:COX15/CtaA family protein [Aromatoleum petrolei]|uniref:Heme A synthase n=1 Tax=Aromatoleum petrolei TaxID=76116 RepID=A0ABX1MM23_9RHOO|nr:COX15/CtaA family protein [Aromatoleum petrolei]NMF87401.1 heme A synthase [Aromatoleum petrolei]QTQ35768.1 putative cytochrome oxidase assembly protein, CtaA family [Aromatoleum petrolei]